MGSQHTLISKETKIVGEVHFTGEMIIQGAVVGNIIAEGVDGGAELEISQCGRVEGQIHAPKIIVRGLLNGDIHASKHVELAATAVINGDVYYQLLEVVKGAQVNGNLIRMDKVDKTVAVKKEAEPA
jgi:cytoskeletal protein CcmA (bactofilin family)